MIRKIFRRLRKRDQGVSFIEFAVVLPILLALVIGIIEFGWIYTGYIVINGAAREGARLAARGAEMDEEINIDDWVENHAEFIKRAGGTVSIESISDKGQSEEITVKVGGSIPLLFKFLGGDGIPFPLLADPFPLKAEASMRREY